MYLLLIYSTELCEANFNSNTQKCHGIKMYHSATSFPPSRFLISFFVIHVGRSHLLHFTDMYPIIQYFALYSSWAFKFFPIYGYYKSSHSK